MPGRGGLVLLNEYPFPGFFDATKLRLGTGGTAERLSHQLVCWVWAYTRAKGMTGSHLLPRTFSFPRAVHACK